MARFEELTVVLPDGYRAFGRYWGAVSGGDPGAARGPNPRGAVLFHHGIQSHCGWFERSGAALAAAGYCVLQIDRRGSGRNEIDRGHAASAVQLMADSIAAGDELLRRSDLTTYHIAGVSWGGKLAVAHYVTRPERVSGLTLVTPGLFPLVGVSKETMAAIGFAMLYEPEKHFDIPLNEPELLTSDARWQRFFESDTLTLRQCTAGFYLASRRMDRIVNRLRECKPVPIHLMLAGDERIIDNEKTLAFVSELGWQGLRITHYASARHSLEFDVPDQYCNDLIGFLNGSIE